MQLTVTVVTGAERPTDGTPLLVEVRDTSRMDVMAVTVSSITTQVGAAVPEGTIEPTTLAVVGFDLPDELVIPGALTVFAHVDITGSGELAAGDLLTVQAYPVTGPELTVDVVRI